MLLLGHAAVSARRGPRGTCQETRAALWAPAECGVTARSASDGVDVNGIRVHHRRLQYRRYQCGMFWEVAQTAPAGVLCSHPLGGTLLFICARGVRGWVVPFSAGVLFRSALAIVGVCFVRM